MIRLFIRPNIMDFASKRTGCIALSLIALVACCDTSGPPEKTDNITRVACLGNSVTAGENLEKTYPERLQELLGDSYRVYNYGRPGWPVPRPELAVEYDTIRHGGFFDTTWDIVISKFGTNDGRYCIDGAWYCWDGSDVFRDRLDWYLDTLATLPGSPVMYHCLPVPAFGIFLGIEPVLVNDSITPFLRSYYAGKSLNIIDCHTPLVDSGHYFPDNIHPNDAGAQLIADIVYEAISSH